MKRYILYEEGNETVSEPVVTVDSHVGQSCVSPSVRNDGFDSLWRRSLSIEEFKHRCISKLIGMYEKDN